MNTERTVEDLYLASWLLSNDVVLQGHERNYGYSIFYFEGGPKTERLVEEFSTNGLLGAPPLMTAIPRADTALQFPVCDE